MSTIGEALQAKKSTDVGLGQSEIGIFLNLINERKHPLDLVRELLSNAGALQVGATRIEISYTKDREGHVFEVEDDGCGMFHTGNPILPWTSPISSWAWGYQALPASIPTSSRGRAWARSLPTNRGGSR